MSEKSRAADKPWRPDLWSPATADRGHWCLSLCPEWDLKQKVNIHKLSRIKKNVFGALSLSLSPIHLHCCDSSENSTKGENPLGSAIMPSDEPRLQRWLNMVTFIWWEKPVYCYNWPFVSPARNCRAWRTRSDQQGTAENHVLRVLAGDDCHACTLSSSWGSRM